MAFNPLLSPTVSGIGSLCFLFPGKIQFLEGKGLVSHSFIKHYSTLPNVKFCLRIWRYRDEYDTVPGLFHLTARTTSANMIKHFLHVRHSLHAFHTLVLTSLWAIIMTILQIRKARLMEVK